MSIFQIGLSGLKSTQSALEVTSNNIANSSTSGYKKSSTEFAAVYNGGQRGGVKVADIKEDFTTTGGLVQTGNALDMAISGSGFFILNVNGKQAYTQAGQFGTDNNLNIVNSTGGYLQGYGIDADGNIIPGVLTDLKVEGTNIAAKASDEMSFAANLNSASDIIPYSDPFDPSSGSAYNFSQSTEIFDSQGNSHIMTQYFNHTGTNEWQVMYFVDGKPLAPADISGGATVNSQNVTVTDSNGVETTKVAGAVTVTFDSNGKLIALDGSSPATDESYEVNLRFSPLDDAGNPNGAGDVNFALNMTGTTQYGSGFSLYANEANGYTSGDYSGVSVDSEGQIWATFTNGESKLQGQLVLATFANVNGLEQGNNTVWYSTQESGSPLYNTAGSGTVGQLLTGQYMNSNVDISEQLVDLISFQQNYQANAKSISTADQMMQVLFQAL